MKNINVLRVSSTLGLSAGMLAGGVFSFLDISSALAGSAPVPIPSLVIQPPTLNNINTPSPSPIPTPSPQPTGTPNPGTTPPADQRPITALQNATSLGGLPPQNLATQGGSGAASVVFDPRIGLSTVNLPGGGQIILTNAGGRITTPTNVITISPAVGAALVSPPIGALSGDGSGPDVPGSGVALSNSTQKLSDQILNSLRGQLAGRAGSDDILTLVSSLINGSSGLLTGNPLDGNRINSLILLSQNVTQKLQVAGIDPGQYPSGLNEVLTIIRSIGTQSAGGASAASFGLPGADNSFTSVGASSSFRTQLQQGIQ